MKSQNTLSFRKSTRASDKIKEQNPQPSAESRMSAFTLIELLVVIAIMAILAAILMPALSSSRARAAQIQCTSNLKSTIGAVQSYCDDFDEYLPFMKKTTGTTYASGYLAVDNPAWYVRVAGYLGYNALKPGSDGRAYEFLVANPTGGRVQGKINGVLRCPTDEVAWKNANYFINGHYLAPVSFSWNKEMLANSDNRYGDMIDTGNFWLVRRNKLKKPSCRYGIGDSHTTPVFVDFWNLSSTDYNAANWKSFVRHSEKSNVAMLDGHCISAGASYLYQMRSYNEGVRASIFGRGDILP